MKELFVIRHAKSSWADAGLSDHDRPLNNRGIGDAPLMGSILRAKEYTPDLIISSTANRAQSTAKIIARELACEAMLTYESAIYEASHMSLLQLVNKLDDQYNRVYLVGHNPGFTYLAEKLTDVYFGNIPTCGIVGIRFAFENWKLVSAGTGENFYYDFPKNHK